MNLIEQLDSVIEHKITNKELKDELNTLVKMLKDGFEQKTVAIEKPAKVYAIADEKQLAKYYDTLANQIKGIQLTGNLEKFKQYVLVHHGIEINTTSEEPNITFIKSKKKFQKFTDSYTKYYLEDLPKNAVEATKKILKSINAVASEVKTDSDAVKDELKSVIELQNEHSPTTVKTVDKILTNARLKSVPIEDVANDIESVLELQYAGLELLKKGD